MRRFLISSPALVLAVVALAAADDSPKAAATRQKFQKKISVEYKDTLLSAVIDDLKEKVEGLSVRPDNKGGVSNNLKITYKADNKTLAEVLNGICDKHDLGYFVISQPGNAYDGGLKLTRGKERGYADGQAPKDAKTEAKAKAKEKPKPAEKKAEVKAKEETRPAENDPAKAETDAARRLKFAKELIESKKAERARDRLEEIVKQFPKTKAAAEARELLEKLDK